MGGAAARCGADEGEEEERRRCFQAGAVSSLGSQRSTNVVLTRLSPRSDLEPYEPEPIYEEQRRTSLPARQQPLKPPKPPIAPAKANRIAAWSMSVHPAGAEVEEPFAGPAPPLPPPAPARRAAARPKSTYLEYDYTQPPPPPPNGEVEDRPRLLKSAMKGGRAGRGTPAPESESLDGVIDPFEPATVHADAAMHYGSFYPKR